MTTTAPQDQPLSAEELDRLEALARAATQGPWKRSERLNGPFWHISSGHTIGGEPCKSGRQAIAAVHGESKKGAAAYAAMFEANADFIAAANPATVLDLIAQARAAQQSALSESSVKPHCSAPGAESAVQPAGAADTTASASIDTPEFQALAGTWCGASQSCDQWTRTVGAKQAWKDMIAYIDSRATLAPVAAQQAAAEAKPLGYISEDARGMLEAGRSITVSVTAGKWPASPVPIYLDAAKAPAAQAATQGASIEAERADFEAWAELTDHQKRGAQHDVVGWYYFDELTNDRWKAWQACAGSRTPAAAAGAGNFPSMKAVYDIVYKCRQSGKDTTYDIVCAAIEADRAQHAKKAAPPDPIGYFYPNKPSEAYMLGARGCAATVPAHACALYTDAPAAAGMVELKDHNVRQLVNDLTAIGEKFGTTQQLRSRVSDAVTQFLGAQYGWKVAAERGAGMVGQDAKDAAAYNVQWWLASVDQYGNATLVDGTHDGRAGVNKAAFLFDSLGLTNGRKLAVAKVELSEPKPSSDGVNMEAVGECNRARVSVAAQQAQASAKGDRNG